VLDAQVLMKMILALDVYSRFIVSGPPQVLHSLEWHRAASPEVAIICNKSV
jgi:hypothetical protein